MFAMPVAQMSVSDPRTVSGCVAMLRSDLGITISSGVSTWANQASNGASADATQATGAWRPSYSAGGLNGRSKITFNGAQASGGNGLNWALDLAGAQTVCIILQHASTPGANIQYTQYAILNVSGNKHSEAATLNFSGYQNQSFTSDFIGSSGATTVGDSITFGTAGHVSVTTFNGGTSTTPGNYTQTVDGSSQTVVASGIFGISSSQVGSLGCIVASSGAQPTYSMNGDLYEIIAYNRVLTADEIGVIAAYAKKLYGL